MKHKFFLIGAVLTLAACAPQDNPPPETGAASGTVAMPTPITLADVAGTWNVTVKPEVGDSILTSYELMATADTTGWTMTFPGRAAVPVHVLSVMGDSITTHAGPYESALRKGVMVNTTAAIRLRDGMLHGTGVARYTVTTPDSVLRVRFEGTKKM
jgi:hypothetical protein